MPLHKATKQPPIVPLPTNDPLFSSVALLLPLRTDFNDRSLNARSLTNQNVSLSESQAKFGSQSAKFANFGYLDYQGGDLNFPNDFTFEVWIYQVSRPTSISSVLETYQGGVGYSMAISNGALVLFDGGTAFTGISEIPLNQWSHLAAVRRNGILTLWLNGVPDLVARNTTALTAPGNLRIGTNFALNFQQDAYFQDLRLTRAARSPILPTQPFPTNG